MIVTCEQCQARFKLADEKIKAEGTKVRCSKCQSVFSVFPPPPIEPAEEPLVAASPFPEQPATAPAPEAATAVAPAESGGSYDEFEPPTGEDDRAAFAFTDETPEESSAPSHEASLDPSEGSTDEFDHVPGEIEFDSAFSGEPASPQEPEASRESGEFDFGIPDTPSEAEPGVSATERGEFDFSESAMAEETVPGTFDFEEDAATQEPGGEFDFSAETGPLETIGATPGQEFDFSDEGPGFGEEEENRFLIGDPQQESSVPAQGDDSWGTQDGGSFDALDFEEPQFESKLDAPPRETEKSSIFGEIDFSEDDQPPFPSFDAEPDFNQPSPERSETFVPSPPPETPAPPVPRQALSRPPGEEQLTPPPIKRRSPASRMVLVLGVLLLVLFCAGGYLYMSGDGERLIKQAVMKIKGEKPAGPVEQLITLSSITTSYVQNRDAGQLLVAQGEATNNFSTPRSAIAVKGLLLDASGKVVKQQTVYCGNHLKEEKLRTLPFAAIEEAMNNQIGDSLSNMNVKPGTSLKFTIVFRDVPDNIANINFEVTDSKPGSN